MHSQLHDYKYVFENWIDVDYTTTSGLSPAGCCVPIAPASPLSTSTFCGPVRAELLHPAGMRHETSGQRRCVVCGVQGKNKQDRTPDWRDATKCVCSIQIEAGVLMNATNGNCSRHKRRVHLQ